MQYLDTGVVRILVLLYSSNYNLLLGTFFLNSVRKKVNVEQL